MKKVIAAIMLWLPAFSYSQLTEIPSLDASSRTLSIPYLKYQVGNNTIYIRAELQGSADFTQFTLRNAAKIGTPTAIDIQNVAGQYTGALAAYFAGTKTKIGPFSGCPDVPFNPGSTELAISVTGSQIRMDLDMFPDLVCRMEGSVNEGALAGNFQCSDFNSGSWSSTIIKTTVETNSIATNVSLIGKDCSFDMSFSGMRK